MGPIPIAQEPRKKSCPETISSGCVIWDGPNIPCLGLCEGMKMTDAMYKEMQLTCSLLTQLTGDLTTLTTPAPIDFSVLNFGCAWSPVISTWTCPLGQVFIPRTGTPPGAPPGYCGVLGPVGTGVYFPGIGWVAGATTAVPIFGTAPNPVPKPSTLIDVLQIIIDAVPCCSPCS